MIRFIFLLSVVACEHSEPTPETPPKPVDAQPVPVIDSAPKPDCQTLGELELEVRLTYGAMNSLPHHRKAIELWRSTAPACRTGRWHLAASRLLDLFRDDPLEIDSIKFSTAEGALTAALEQPDDIEVLARAAELSSYGRQVSLPVDACSRVQALDVGSREDDQVHFVCARRAIANGDGAAAGKELSAIVGDGWSSDLELARAQAAVLRGEHAAAKRHAVKAIEIANRRDYRVTTADREAVIRLAKQVK